MATENIVHGAILMSWDGSAAGGVGFGGFSTAIAIETSEHRAAIAPTSYGTLDLFDWGVSTAIAHFEYPYVSLNPRCGVIDMVPLDRGEILAAVACTGSGPWFVRFGPLLAPVDSFPGGAGTNVHVVGMTRRPDGSIVACTRDFLNTTDTRLTAYTEGGTTLWSKVIGGGGGAVASDAQGGLYVARGDNATHVDVFTSSGDFDHTWDGPTGGVFLQLRDLASTLDGTVLYTLEGPKTVRAFGNLPTAVRRSSWGQLKQSYR